MHNILTLIVSFIALLWAANHLVTGASGLAAHFKISPLIIGLTVVAIGTCIPELTLSILSSINNKNDLTIGNAIGSNIANIGLVLGVTILIKPQSLDYNTLKKAYPILIIAMLFVYSLIMNGYLGRIDGCLLLLACIALISTFIYLASRSALQDPFFNAFKTAMIASRSLKANCFNIILGLLILPVSARSLITVSTELASSFGVSELTIGLTILAIGTTLPELATAIMAAFKQEEEMAIGIILGANTYNLLLILAFPAIINPNKISTLVLQRDMPVMMSLTLLLLFLNYNYKKTLSSWHGGILLLIYICYISSIIIRAQ